MFAGGAVCFIGAPLCPLVSAVLARGVRAVIPRSFFCSRDRGSEDAVIFSETGDDGYFDPTGSPGMPNRAAVSCWTELRSTEFSATEYTSGRRTSMGNGTAASILQSLILNSRQLGAPPPEKNATRGAGQGDCTAAAPAPGGVQSG